jgi:integrase
MIHKKLTKGRTRYKVRLKDRLGRQYPSRTFDRRVDAERYERQLKDERDRLIDAPSQYEKTLTVEGYFQEWFSHRERATHKGWQYSQRQMFTDYVQPIIGPLKLIEVQPPHVGRVLDGVYKLERSDQTALHVYNLMHKMFGDAIDYFGHIDRSPVLKKDRPRVALKERAFLRKDEAEKLFEVTENHFLGIPIRLGIVCGLRPCEIQALQMKHIDQAGQEVLIRQAFKRKAGLNVIEPFPKQEDWGRATITRRALGYLLAKRAGANEDDFVARGKNGGMLNYLVFLRGLKSICKKAGLPEITPHELRHSCSAYWVSVGATSEDVGRQLNQKTASTTKRYMHGGDERLSAFANRLDGETSAPVSGHFRDTLPARPELVANKSPAETAANSWN